MMKRVMVATICLVASAVPAHAQDPFNLAVPVERLATLFTGLYGPRGLILDSEATLPGEQPHSAHFNSDFQTNFTQFGTALVGQPSVSWNSLGIECHARNTYMLASTR